MKTQKLGLLGISAVFLVLSGFYSQSYAGVSVGVGVGVALPPPIVVETPPAMVALPGATGVYVAPEVSVDLFFWNGWWWRPWGGYWYRSHYYNRGWGYYRGGVPAFYGRVNPGWRGYYGSHSWNGRPWHYRTITHQQFVHGHYGHYRH